MGFHDVVQSRDPATAFCSGFLPYLWSLSLPVWDTYLFSTSCCELVTLWYDLPSQGNEDFLATLMENIPGSLLSYPLATNSVISRIQESGGGGNTCGG